MSKHKSKMLSEAAGKWLGEIACRLYGTHKEFAKKLGMHPDSFRAIINRRRPMSKPAKLRFVETIALALHDRRHIHFDVEDFDRIIKSGNPNQAYEDLLKAKESNDMEKGGIKSNDSLFPDAELDRLAALLSMSRSELVSRTEKEKKKLGAKELLERSQKERRFISSDVQCSFIGSYYGNPGDSGLGRYSIVVDDKVRNTSIFVRPSDMPLSLPIDRLDVDLISDLALPGSNALDELRRYAPAVLARLDRLGVRLWNAPLYRLVFENIQQGKASFSLAHFFDYRFEMGLLEDELIDAIVDCQGDVNVFVGRKKQLALRARLLPDLERLGDLKGRMCAGGIGVVFALKMGEEYLIPLQFRSAKVSDGREKLGVLPKGFHGHLVDHLNELNIKWTMFHELFEEAFGGKKVERPTSHLAYDWYFSKCPGLKWFQINDRWRAEVVAYGLNAMSGNFDFGILLIVEDPDYLNEFKAEMKRNWEAERTFMVSTAHEERIMSLLQKESWASESLFHFVEALHRLKELHPQCVRLPRIDRKIGQVPVDAHKIIT